MKSQRDDLGRASVRLTAQFTALVLVILAVVGGLVYAIVARSVAESSQRSAVAAAQVDSPDDAPPGTFVTIVDRRSGGRIIAPPGMPEELLDTAAIQSVASGDGEVMSRQTVDGHDYLVLTTSPTSDLERDRIVQVALDQHESAEELGRLRTALLIGGGVALVLASAVSYLMARRAIKPLADALELQRRFVADASHELRTPLTLLDTRAQMLKRRSPELPPNVAESVDEMLADTRALAEILDDLLIAADPRSVANPIAVDLARVADEAVARLRDAATARGISLTRTGETESVNVLGSPAAILRLIIALATNALDHATTSVTISIRSTSRHAVIRVIDDGPGFAPEIVANAFDRFASGRSSTLTDVGNSRHYGLGLSIVAEIVRRHQGAVTIEQSHRGGAAVVCTIPLSPQRAIDSETRTTPR